MSEKILIVAPLKGDQLKSQFRELVNGASKFDPAPAVLLPGDGANNAVEEAASAGTHIQYTATYAEQSSVEQTAKIVVTAAKMHEATQIWFASGENTKAIAPLVAAETGGGMIQDVFGIEEQDEGKVYVRSAFAGKIEQRLTINRTPAVIGFGAGAFPAEQIAAGTVNRINVESTGGDVKAKITDIIKEIAQELDLMEAKRIVGVGRGSGGSEGVDFVAKFAKNINAALGGSRAVIDSGWLPKNLQIGQTGKIIAPTLYICVGISGAIQHQAGIGKAKVILAINKDADAPIFSIADYGIVGDLFEVLPHLEREILAIAQ